MKLTQNIFVILAVLTFGIACNNSEKSTTYESSYEDPDYTPSHSDSVVNTAKKKGIIEFANTSFDFGTIDEGDQVEYSYEFTNVGESPIILSKVIASCGCTTPSYTSTPVAPGEKGNIKVAFDSKGQPGKQQKVITIQSNAEESVMTVELKGEVNKK